MTTPLAAFQFTPLEEFAAIDEPGAEPLAATPDGGVVIASNGIVIVYGDGGAGKTTLTIDLSFALARGTSWLGLVEAARPLRIALIENEGPRPEFRRKVRAKLAANPGGLDGRIGMLEEPWGVITLADPEHRRALAAALVELEADILVLGPLVSAGEFPSGGTPDEVSHFEEHLADLRQLVDRPLAVLLVHHENRAGQISGAWNRLPDTLVHVTAQGNGRTRLHWKKVRFASSLHQTTTQLIWADGESYVAEEKHEVTRDTIAESLIAAARLIPGGSWTKIRDLTDDKGAKIVRGGAEDVMDVRDELLARGALLNLSTRKGGFNLWAADDPAAAIRSDIGTVPERLPFIPPASATGTEPFAVPSIERNGTNGTETDEPELESEGLEWR